MENAFDKYNELISKAKEDKLAMEKKALENPEQFIKEMGIDINNIDIEQLNKLQSELIENSLSLENLFKGKAFKNLNNFQDSIKHKTSITNADKIKLQELGIIAFYSDRLKKQHFCFINNGCDKIIDAHSIQEKGELSLISEDNKVISFIQNIQSDKKEIQEIEISKASTFKGFCHKHDQIFEPIDVNRTIPKEQKHFLYSIRSFAHSYFNTKSFKEYFSNILKETSSTLPPVIDNIKSLANSIGMTLPSEFNDIEIPKINKEQLDSLELERFESQRTLLLNYISKNEFDKLDYLEYEINHLCPIVCASWMVLHINFGNGFLIQHNDNKPYYGLPIIISILPEGKKTKIILSRFKTDNGSDLIFNNFKNLLKIPINFEIEISKLIIENVENFYLSPVFWKKLNIQEKEIIINALTTVKNKFPMNRTEFNIVNFFDIKYHVN